MVPLDRSVFQDSRVQRETTAFREKSAKMDHLDNQLVSHSPTWCSSSNYSREQMEILVPVDFLESLGLL